MRLVALAVLFLLIPARAVFAAGDGKGEATVQWVRLTHAGFFDLYDEHPEGFTLRFIDGEGRELAMEFHAPDGTVYLDDTALLFRGQGEISYAEGERFCYAYAPDYAEEFCWSYFRSERGYREESDDGTTIDFFEVLPGNIFVERWGSDWRSRF